MLAAVQALLAEIGEAPGAGVLASALPSHLGAARADAFPPEARQSWREIAALLKADPQKPLPPRAMSAISSWPGDRIAKLVESLHRLHAILEKVENDRLEDEIRDNIRRHYL